MSLHEIVLVPEAFFSLSFSVVIKKTLKEPIQPVSKMNHNITNFVSCKSNLCKRFEVSKSIEKLGKIRPR